MIDPIAEALDELVPAFDPVEGDWQAILKATSLSAGIGPADRRMSVTRRKLTATRRTVRFAAALVVVAVIATGVAWAAGGSTPLALFKANPQASMSAGFGSLFDQTVIADSLKQVGSVDIPKVGPIAFWYGPAHQGGWCAGLRLSDGSWLGTGASPLEGGGAVPGCVPTRQMINGKSDGFDWHENDVDASSVGGGYWRIRFGRITAPGAAKVTDLVSGTSTDVIDGDLFILAFQDNGTNAPTNFAQVHLVAYDKAGKVVADDCPSCSGY